MDFGQLRIEDWRHVPNQEPIELDGIGTPVTLLELAARNGVLLLQQKSRLRERFTTATSTATARGQSSCSRSGQPSPKTIAIPLGHL